MVETAPTGTEMPWRKRHLNFMSVQRDLFPMECPLCSLSLASPVQSREQLINLVSSLWQSCFSPGLSITSCPKKGGADTENSFLPRTLSALFIFRSSKGALVGSLQLAHPKISLPAFTNCNSPCIGVEKLFSFPFKEQLGVLHSQTSSHHTDFPWAIIAGSWCAPRRTKDHVVLLTVKNTTWEAPAILKDCQLKQGTW